MAFITLEIGPTWRMQMLRGLLEERGVPAVVQGDDDMAVYLGQAPSTSLLQVPEEAVESARSAVQEAQRDGSKALAQLRFKEHRRFSRARPLRAMLLDVAFWLALFLVAFWVFSRIAR